jgi:adenylylsulfate kinase-like enzyme
MDRGTKLIILRGNSGSGKTTTGKALQRKFGYGTMLISQDVVRRDMLFVKDGHDTEASSLLLELALYGKGHCNIVIMEGIFNSKWYKKLFNKLLDEFNNQIFAYYFDIPFEETLNRHKLKPNANEFGEKELREWWNEKDLLDIIPEVCLHKELCLNEVVEKIYKEVIQ